MNTLKIIADSGSTKTDWYIGTDSLTGCYLHSTGMNPFFLSQDEIRNILDRTFPADTAEEMKTPYGIRLAGHRHVGEVHFYGAGCTPEMAPKVKAVLAAKFPEATVFVESDIVGAARALFGHSAGIACILGTGSNSCEYDGEGLTRQVPSLGYVLGDYGSGNALGRGLLSALYKGRLPEAVGNLFMKEYDLTRADILNKVYKEPLANRFLASLTPFLAKYRNIKEVKQVAVNELRQFIHLDLRQYDIRNLRAGFVGSIAHYFSEELREACHREGVHIDKIIQSPMEGLVAFHFNS